MTLFVDLILLAAIIALIIINIVKAPNFDFNDILYSFPFLIIITDKKFRVKHSNADYKINFIYPIDYKETNSTCHIRVNEKELECHTFISNGDIYFICKENKKSDISSILTLMSMTDNPNEYISQGVEIQTILEYTGKLLNADWANYYSRNNNVLIENESWYSIPNIENDDKVIYLLDLDYTKPFFFLEYEHLPNNRKKRWDELHVKTKLVVPILYEKEIEKQVTFAYSPSKTPNMKIINLVVGILNFIIKLKIKFEKEQEKQKQFDKIQQSILQFLDIENKRYKIHKKNLDNALKNTIQVIETFKS